MHRNTKRLDLYGVHSSDKNGVIKERGCVVAGGLWFEKGAEERRCGCRTYFVLGKSEGIWFMVVKNVVAETRSGWKSLAV